MPESSKAKYVKIPKNTFRKTKKITSFKIEGFFKSSNRERSIDGKIMIFVKTLSYTIELQYKL